MIGPIPKSNAARDGEFNLGAGPSAAPDGEVGSYFFCPLAHSRKSPMPFTARVKHSRINSMTIITDE